MAEAAVRDTPDVVGTVGDTIECRLRVEGEPYQLVSGVAADVTPELVRFEGTVSPPLICYYDEGWEFQLLKKGRLDLPQTVAEIEVELYTGEKHIVIGKGEIWRTLDGVLVPVADVKNWTTPVPVPDPTGPLDGE